MKYIDGLLMIKGKYIRRPFPGLPRWSSVKVGRSSTLVTPQVRSWAVFTDTPAGPPEGSTSGMACLGSKCLEGMNVLQWGGCFYKTGFQELISTLRSANNQLNLLKMCPVSHQHRSHLELVRTSGFTSDPTESECMF